MVTYIETEMARTPTLEEIYNTYKEIGGFRHYIGFDEWDSDRIVYAVGIDTSHLDEVPRQKERFTNEQPTPQKVTWNGETYKFTLTVFSIRSNSVKTWKMAQVHDRGYTDSYAFVNFPIYHAIDESDEWELNRNRANIRCSSCRDEIMVRTPTGGVVTKTDEDINKRYTDKYCVECALEKMGREDILKEA